MYSLILVPFDGSAFAERALPAALAIARDTGAAVELVHVHEPLPPSGGAPMYEPRLDQENRAAVCRTLDALEHRLARDASLSIRLTCLTGDVRKALEAHIAASGADLVVMSTHGAGGFVRALMGSVADHVVRHAHVPILLVRPGATGIFAADKPLFDHMLFPLDGSELATEIIEPAIALASPGQTVLTLLHVIVVPMARAGLPYPSNGLLFSQADIDRQQREIAPHLEAVAGRLRARGFTTDVTIQPHEQVARCILDFAAQQGIDLVAMSTHGRGGIGRVMLGSVTDAVSREATLPVLAFRPATPAR